MSWPAPTTPPPDANEPAGTRPRREPNPASRAAPSARSTLADLLRRVPAAASVATVGGALVLVAAAIVVVGNWDAIGRAARVLGLSLTAVGLIVSSERLRAAAPSTARIAAHVGTFLVATVGIAATSLAGFTWPACLVAGGVAAAVATELQARRWTRARAYRSGQVVAFALAATGVGEVSGTTGGLVAAIAALGLLAGGASRRAAALAMLAVCSPALAALADAGIGAGTFEQAGLVGERLSWSGPVVGVLAAMVLGTVARRRRNNGLMIAAVSAPLVGGVTGLAAIDGSAAAWLCVPGFVIVAAELTLLLLPTDRHADAITAVADGLGALVAVSVASLAPWLGGDARIVDGGPASMAVPLVIALFGVTLTTARWSATDRRLGDIGIAGACSAALGIVTALAVPSVWVAAASVALVPIAAFLSRRLSPIAIGAPWFWSLVSIHAIAPDGDPVRTTVALGLVVALTAVLVAARARTAARQGWYGRVEVTIVTVATATVTGLSVASVGSVAALVAAAATVAAYMLVDRRLIGWAAAPCISVAMFAVPAAAVDDDLGLIWIGWAACTLAFGLAAAVHRSTTAASIAASGLVVTASTATIALSMTADEFVQLAMIAVVALTGSALAVGRRRPVDAAAGTAGVALIVGSSLDVAPSWAALAWIVVGAQMVTVGVLRGRGHLIGAGALVATSGATSWWFESGWHDAVARWLEGADVRGGDVWFGVALITAIVTGVVLRRRATSGSWAAYGPSMMVAALWLLPVQIDRTTAWAFPLALGIGLSALAIGAWRRLAAPFTCGTALAVTTATIAVGTDIGRIPVWVWFAVGGLGLLGTATVIERVGRRGGDLTELTDAWR